MTLGLKIGKCSLQGVRARNDDVMRVHRTDLFQLIQLADGCCIDHLKAMAAERAVEIIERELVKCFEPTSLAENTKLIQHAVLQANEVLKALNGLMNEPDEMLAATVILGLWSENHMHVCGIGNCLAYLVRTGVILPLNTKHVFYGFLSGPEYSEDDPHPGMVVELFLGGELDGDVEVKTLPCEARDRFVFCTDGLTCRVDEAAIFTLLRTEIDVQRCAERLCQQALDNGTRDNVSCIVVEVVQTAD